MAIKIVIVLTLLVIVGSLASALFYMMTDHGKSTRAVKALSIRVGLSVGLFAMLFVAYAAGWIQPHGVYPQ